MQTDNKDKSTPIDWTMHGAVSQDANFIYKGIDLSQHLNHTVNKLEKSNDIEFPKYHGRPIPVYKTNTNTPIYFGFAEVSNGCFCYWLPEEK